MLLRAELYMYACARARIGLASWTDQKYGRGNLDKRTFDVYESSIHRTIQSSYGRGLYVDWEMRHEKWNVSMKRNSGTMPVAGY